MARPPQQRPQQGQSGASGVPGQPQGTPGLPENYEILHFEGFEGLNTKPQRPAIGDQQCAWLDNWVPIGPNNLRALPGQGTPIYTTAGPAITHFQFFDCGYGPIIQQCIIFFADGSAVIQNVGNNTTLYTFSAGTFTGTNPRTQAAQWGGTYLLIADPSGYYIWDGAILYKSGTISPLEGINYLSVGQTYSTPPTVTVISPTGGGGAAFTATVANGSIASIIPTNSGAAYPTDTTLVVSFAPPGGPTVATAYGTATIGGGQVTGVSIAYGGAGYSTTTKVSFISNLSSGSGATGNVTTSGGSVVSVSMTNGGAGYFVAPTVVFQDTNNPVAVATMKTFPALTGNNAAFGSVIETFQSRAWIGFGSRVVFTAPGTASDFDTGDAAGAFRSTDSFLRIQYTKIIQSNGLLYLFGDSSITYISGVQVSGTPAITTFSNLNVDPQIGTTWTDTVTSMGVRILFANQYGVYALEGGVVQKISPELDGIFQQASNAGAFNSSFQPSACVGVIFGMSVFALLLPIVPQYGTSATYQAIGVNITAPAELVKSGPLAVMPSSYANFLFSVWVYMPDDGTALHGMWFSNVGDHSHGNPGISIGIFNDQTHTPQIIVRAADASNALILDASFTYSAWSAWANVMVSVSTSAQVVQVYIGDTPATVSSVTWYSTNPVAEASGTWTLTPAIT